MSPIGYVRSPYTDPGDIPKGLGAKHETEGSLVIFPEFGDGLKDIEGFSHLYVIWVFHLSKSYNLLVTPPSDVSPHGVFATRSPYRPNPLGLTVVRLLERSGLVLRVRGVDMVDHSPILDLKPYLTSIPEEELCRGWLADAEKRQNKRPDTDG